MTVALVLRPDGDLTELTLGEGPNRHAFYAAIGCTRVDVVGLTDRIDMWIDDEGLYTQEINVPATRLARRFGFVHQPYHGTVILCGADPQGASIDLTAAQFRGLLTHLDDITQQ